MIFKILNDEVPKYLGDIVTTNSNNTRSYNKLIVHRAVNNTHKTSLHISGSTMWNSLPEDIRNSESVKSFISNLQNYLLENKK